MSWGTVRLGGYSEFRTPRRRFNSLARLSPDSLGSSRYPFRNESSIRRQVSSSVPGMLPELMLGQLPWTAYQSSTQREISSMFSGACFGLLRSLALGMAMILS